MTKAQFEHAIRAAGAVLDTNKVLVIGSQALHASVTGRLPPEALRSVEADVAALPSDRDGHLADLLDGAIGEASQFHETFGYYVQGVVASTAVLPVGWRRRLVRYASPGTAGVVAWCLEVHDLWISKAIAGRPKDLEFCRALLKRGVVRPATLRVRLAKVKGLDDRVRRAVEARIAA